MKTFNHLNYYEILKIPVNADAMAVKRAYREALEIYDAESLITYSLFSDEQRADLLQSIDEAFHTLVDGDKRRRYNQMLIDSSRIDAAAFEPHEGHAPMPPADMPEPFKHRDLQAWVKKKSKDANIQSLIDDISARDVISGSDIKRLRKAFEIDISEIFEITRIAGTILRSIEDDQYGNLPADVFLRSFLKSYAQILQIDPNRLIEGYLNAKTSCGSGRSS